MSGKNTKSGFSIRISAPVKRYASYLDVDWNIIPAGFCDCSPVVVKDIGACWASSVNDPIAQKDADLFFHGPAVVTPVSVKTSIADYLWGAGSAMNPFPQDEAHFYESDLEAMASDWNTTVSDMYTVLRACDAMKEKYEGHEQPSGWRKPTTETGRLKRDRTKAAT